MLSDVSTQTSTLEMFYETLEDIGIDYRIDRARIHENAISQVLDLLIKMHEMIGSVYEIDDFADDGSWDNVEKIVLDKKALEKIPLNKRLVFVSKEHSRFELYHKTVVDFIMQVKPEGLFFIPVDKWYEGIQFDQLK